MEEEEEPVKPTDRLTGWRTDRRSHLVQVLEGLYSPQKKPLLLRHDVHILDAEFKVLARLQEEGALPLQETQTHSGGQRSHKKQKHQR